MYSRIDKLFLYLTIFFVTFTVNAKSSELNSCLASYKPKPKTEYAVWLESNSDQTTNWVSQQSAATLRKLKASPNYTVLKDVVLYKNATPYTISSSSSENFNYRLKFEAIGEPQSIYQESKTGLQKSIKILDTRDIKIDGSFVLLKVFASKNDSHLIVIGTDNGSTDLYNLYIYDIKNKKVVKEYKTNAQLSITWKSNSEFYLIDMSPAALEKGEWMKSYNVLTNKEKLILDERISMLDENYYLLTENNHTHLVSRSGEKLFIPKGVIQKPEYFIESIKKYEDTQDINYIFSVKDYGTKQGHVVSGKFNKKTHKTRWTSLFESSTQQVFDKVTYDKDHLSVTYFWGSNITTKVIDYHGKEITEIQNPNCCNIDKIEISKDGKSAKVLLSSYFKSKIPFVYLLGEKRFENSNIEKIMTRHDGVQFSTQIQLATSQDGTKIPVRVSHRKDLIYNSNNPAFIYGYGGFNLEGYMRSFNDKMDMFWMKNGGIIASPALRGGNEFGPKWHQSAKLLNKNKTFEDFVATAKLLQEKQLTSPRLTAIEGASNGGMVVAATGLLYSKHIGAVISVNGVDDQLRKEALDPQFDKGWSSEYGNSEEPKVKEYLKKWSPVYLAQANVETPYFLVLNGREDTRVNPAHSFKLAHALEYHSAHPDKVDLISIKNSGHWMASIRQQNTIGWITQTLKWTWLYNVMNMKAEH